MCTPLYRPEGDSRTDIGTRRKASAGALVKSVVRSLRECDGGVRWRRDAGAVTSIDPTVSLPPAAGGGELHRSRTETNG